MKIPGSPSTNRLLGKISAAAVLAAGVAILYPVLFGVRRLAAAFPPATPRNKVYAPQEKDPSRSSAPDQSTSLNDPEKLGVIEQNYEYDLLEPAKLLHKYVGKEVTLVRSYQENGTTKREEIKATLLSDNNGPVWKIGNDIVTGMYAESLRFPEVPANLYERPTLLMSLENSGARKQTIEASYLANNLTWNSDYVLTVGRDERTPTST